MRNKQDPVEFILEENPELEWDDLHDVREVAELLGAMVEDLEKKVYEPENWLKVSENLDKLEDHYFYLVTHADFGTPMKAKYHNDIGGYFEIKSSDKKIPVEYVNPIIGESKIKYFMPLPEMPEDYKEHGPLYKFLERADIVKPVDEEYSKALQGIKTYAKASPNLLDRDSCVGLTCYSSEEDGSYTKCNALTHTYNAEECYHYFDCAKKGTGVAIPEKDIINNTLVIEPGAFNGEEF